MVVAWTFFRWTATQLPPHIHLLQFSSTDFLRGRLDSADWTRPDQVLVKELLTHYTSQFSPVGSNCVILRLVRTASTPQTAPWTPGVVTWSSPASAFITERLPGPCHLGDTSSPFC